MSSTQRNRRPKGGRPTKAEAARIEDRLRREAIDAFVRDGFDGVTMEQVAQAAGVSKHTLYARYSDKRAMFTTVIPWAMEHLEWLDAVEVEGDDLAAALTAIARSARRRALDPDVVQLIRMVLGESTRFPEIALTATEIGRSEIFRAVIELLRRHAQAGDITVDDIPVAAEQFVGAVLVVPLTFAAFGFRRDAETEDRLACYAVDVFLRGVLPR